MDIGDIDFLKNQIKQLRNKEFENSRRISLIIKEINIIKNTLNSQRKKLKGEIQRLVSKIKR